MNKYARDWISHRQNCDACSLALFSSCLCHSLSLKSCSCLHLFRSFALYALRSAWLQPSERSQGSGTRPSRFRFLDSNVEKVHVRASFENSEISLVVSRRSTSNLSGVRITARISIPSLTDFPLCNAVAPIIVAPPQERTSMLGHGWAVERSQKVNSLGLRRPCQLCITPLSPRRQLYCSLLEEMALVAPRLLNSCTSGTGTRCS